MSQYLPWESNEKHLEMETTHTQIRRLSVTMLAQLPDRCSRTARNFSLCLYFNLKLYFSSSYWYRRQVWYPIQVFLCLTKPVTVSVRFYMYLYLNADKSVALRADKTGSKATVSQNCDALCDCVEDRSSVQ